MESKIVLEGWVCDCHLQKSNGNARGEDQGHECGWGESWYAPMGL